MSYFSIVAHRRYRPSAAPAHSVCVCINGQTVITLDETSLLSGAQSTTNNMAAGISYHIHACFLLCATLSICQTDAIDLEGHLQQLRDNYVSGRFQLFIIIINYV
jgi:hypothetical protein